jgi:hypothetical protein
MGHSSLLWSASHGSQLAARRDKTEQSIIHIWTILRPNLVPRSRGSANGNNVSEVVTVGAESKCDSTAARSIDTQSTNGLGA